MMQGPEAVGMLAMVALVGVSILTLAKAFAKRIAGGSSDAREIEALRDEITQLRAEVDGIRSQLTDLDEIQNRLDFSERLLAQARERGLLGAPKER
jgi:cell division protein FtsB